ncbi:DMP19 family protein [Treponema pedis]|uniref:DMP19 family protein n=1 Tax=Treponema pedis TaxID=409322 RepID=UPI00040D4C8E|nr:DMP19 family protein [Treponema pedis]
MKTINENLTVEAIKEMGEEIDLYRLVDPMWWTVNIYGTYEEYLKSADGFTLEQRYLLAIQWYEAEVDNGGHHQFFSNSTGIVWKDALEGFKLFGIDDLYNNLLEVVEFFGGSISFDREQRCDMLSEAEEKDEKAFYDFLDTHDEFFYANDSFDDKLIDYIKNNPEKFVFVGSYETDDD